MDKANKKLNKKSQVWIETVLYTLIALVMIGAVLAFVKPKIQEMQDKAIIEQTIEVLEAIDAQILSAVQGGPGNTRVVEFGIKRGSLEIVGDEGEKGNRIIFTIEESRLTYSEPEADVPIGNIIVYTEKKGKLNTITLTLDYSDKYDLKYAGEDESKVISKSVTPQKLLISNLGIKDSGILTEINIELIS